MNSRHEITLCMGSSCFARGNGDHVKLIQRFIQNHGCDTSVSLKGCLCQDCCSEGPVIVIDGTRYTQIDPTTLQDLLRHHLLGRSE